MSGRATPLLEVRDLKVHYPVRSGVLHRNTVARKMSRLASRVKGIA